MKNKIETMKKIYNYLKKQGDVDHEVQSATSNIKARLNLLEQRNMFVNDWGLPESSMHVCNGFDYFKSTRGYEDYVTFENFANPNYSIGCPDDGKQPKEGWFMNIRFPSGAYVLGQHYPKEIFNLLFEELKTFNPKHIDTANNSLYFSLGAEHVKTVEAYLGLFDIISKYRQMDSDTRKAERIAELQQQIEILGG